MNNHRPDYIGTIARVIGFEMNSQEPEKATEFYSKVFGWGISEPKWGYAEIITGDKDTYGINGGIAKGPYDYPHGTRIQIEVDVIDEAISKAKDHGAMILREKMEFDDFYLAYLVDPVGIAFALIQKKISKDDRYSKLIGTEIYLRFLEESDAASMVVLNKKNQQFFEPYLIDRSEKFYTVDYQVASIKSSLALMEQDQKYSFGVFLNETDTLIGVISLTEIVRGPIQACWMGYYLDQEQNGHGYTTEAVRLVVDYCFKILKLHRVEAGVMPHNSGSIRVLEKAGFEQEGLNKKNVLINGKWEDHIHFAIVNPYD